MSEQNGVIYALADNGDLLWYRHDGYGDGSFRWAFDAGKKVGNGWNGFSTVFSGDNGVIYAIQEASIDPRIGHGERTGGHLLWYRHDGWRDGSPVWADGPKTVGNGWNGFSTVFSGDNGVIYAIQDNGDLLWYRHNGRSDGSFTWAEGSGKRVGNGWNGFSMVFSGGGGVIYAIQEASIDPRIGHGERTGGHLLWYRHDGWRDGSPVWADGPKTVGNGWNGFSTVFSGGDGPPLWGRLANPGFSNTRVKTTFFFSGQARDGSSPYGCPIGNELGNYTAVPSDLRHLNWSLSQANRDYAINMMTEAGINVVTMSSWGERGLPCTTGWASFAPMQTSPESHDELFLTSIGKPLLIMPLIESRGDWTFRDEFPRWTDGRIAPGTVSQIVDLIRRYLQNPSHPEWADHWATFYDKHGNARHGIGIIQVSSNRPNPNEHEVFARGFDLIAESVLRRTGINVGFFLDVLPPDTSAPGSFKPSAQETGVFLHNTASILGIQCFVPEIWIGSGNEPFLLDWKRDFARKWFSTGIPFLMDISPGYDGHIIFGETAAPANGWTETWRNGLSQLVAEFGRNGIVFNSWNGYTEKMVAVPITEAQSGDVAYQWLKSLTQ